MGLAGSQESRFSKMMMHLQFHMKGVCPWGGGLLGRAEKAQAGILGLQGNGFCERSDGGPVQGEKFLSFSVTSPSAASLCYVSGDQRPSPDLFLSFIHIHAYIYTCIQINMYISVCMLFYFLKFFFFLMWIVLKSSLNLLQYCFCFMFWFLALEHVGSQLPDQEWN